MGILNVTPDSFSDGGRFESTSSAIARGRALAEAGADYVDVGGESTRPGADRVDVDEELRRVLPVVSALASEGIRVSIDTTRARVAAAAIEAGGSLVNDVSGGLADTDMARFIAESGVRWVLMHWRGYSRRMDSAANYTHVVEEVRNELLARVESAVAAGVDTGQLVLDPGLGFAKRAEHDIALLASLDVFVGLGLPVLVGASRKRFLGRILAGDNQPPRPADQRDAATLATSILAAQAGVWGVRVHDAAATVDAMRVITAIRAGNA
ncbi:MAG: dihydropteroate synthase [Comamonadaceae bacterium]|nr:MAG: dihydropteroate synthase [Comamonadaceae bacterium]